MASEHEYDYIICGGGTSGCVIAGRLAEDSSVSILVIEAGDHSDNVPASKIAGGAPQIMYSPKHDWLINDEPASGLNGRQTPLSRGKLLGGSSTLNGTLCVRGLKEDYDQWNLPGWSGDEVFKYMNKAEKFQTEPWFEADEGSHGSSGPILTGLHKNAPISDRIMDSYKSRGFPYKSDMFTTGKDHFGYGHATRTVGMGFRMTSSQYLTQANKRSNVTIMTNTLVDKLKLEKRDGKVTATGVHAILEDGSNMTLNAKSEVILSAGSYCTPAILLRSGIGGKEEISKHGIEQTVDLPGVGKNLQDHLICYAFYEVNEPKLTNDHEIWHSKDAIQKATQQWMTDRTGFLSSFPFGGFAFTRLDERLNEHDEWKNASTKSGLDPMGLSQTQPNVEFFNTEMYGAARHIHTSFPVGGNSSFGMITQLFYPRSRGSVTLKSADPKDNPVVHHDYLSDPLDVLVLAEGCRLGNEIIMEGAGTKDLITGSWPKEVSHHKYTTIEQWKDFAKSSATTCYHPSCTCPMGKDDDPMAVLDEKLQVRGVSGLRVADTSAMPRLINGHPQMAAYAIGEKAADMIKMARK